MKKGLWFALGLVVGATIGGLGTAWYLKRKEKEKSEEDAEQYGEIAEKYIRQPHDEEEVDHEQRIEQLREEKKEKPQPAEPVNYSAMYQSPSLETEHPKDQGEDGEEEPERQAHEYHQKTKDRPPKIISVEEAGNLPPHIESETLFFYSYDEVLVDENNAEIDEPGRLVGECMEKYGFIDNDEKVIFVMNYELSTCYEIQKVFAAFGD